MAQAEVAEDSGDDFVTIPTVAAPVAVPGPVPLPPVSVLVTIGVGAGQRQVLTIPTMETELQSIRAHVKVTPGPHGKHVRASSKWVHSESPSRG